jgi:hypothetical protein
MVQSFTSLPTDWSDRILCYYENATNQVQLARIANVPNWLYERMVFPGQRLLFEALPDAQLEVHVCTGNMTLLERIPCPRLRVREKAQNSSTASNHNDLVDSAE